jgi:hypothetical protein
MSEDIPEITAHAHERGPDGELLPVEKTVSVRGEGETTVRVKPATDGERNRWTKRLEDVGDDVPPEVQTELFESFLPDYEPADFRGAATWRDIRPAIADALANAVFAELFDVETDAFSEELAEHAEDFGEGNPTGTP